MAGFDHRIFNFSAGPSAIPTQVLEKAQSELLNFKASGMSVMEMSHRSEIYEEVIGSAQSKLLSLLGLNSDEYSCLFLQGGARLQFAMVPLNFLDKSQHADLIHTGHWTKLAMKELEKIAAVNLVASSEADNYSHLPELKEQDFSKDAIYVHYCSNNTIAGTQWRNFQNPHAKAVVVDMSSDILSRQLDYGQFDLIYAGAQKNLGPSGVTIVVIKRSWLKNARKDIPSILSYHSFSEAAYSMYNTPPTFAIYLVGLVLEWIEGFGGIAEIEKQNDAKAESLYSFIDNSKFFSCPVKNEDRSKMNVVFRIKDNDQALEKQFVQEAAQEGLSGLKGHRVVGGCRASIYNAMPAEGVNALIEFMKKFEQQH